mgnify:CR=1 FL=1
MQNKKNNKVGFRTYRKKMAAMLLVGMLAVSTAATGCGKKDVDYDVDGNGGSGSGSNADSGSLQGKYGIPESCDTQIATGDSGIQKIAIDAEEVIVPDTGDLYVAPCKKKTTTNDDKKQTVEAVFDKDKGIYEYDYEKRTKSDIQEEIDMYENEKKKNSSDTDMVSYYDTWIEDLKTEMQTAPDEYPAAKDYSGKELLGEINGRKFLVNVDDQVGVSGFVGLKDQLITYRPKDGASGVYFSTPDTGDDLTDVDMSSTNVCTFSKDEAQSIADEFVNKIGMADVTLNKAQDLYWYYYGTDGTTESVDVDGYVFSYTRSINNQPTASVDIYNVDNIMQDDASVSVPAEQCEVYVDSNGVISANWVNYLEITDKTESKDLLSFNCLLYTSPSPRDTR